MKSRRQLPEKPLAAAPPFKRPRCDISGGCAWRPRCSRGGGPARPPPVHPYRPGSEGRQQPGGGPSLPGRLARCSCTSSRACHGRKRALPYLARKAGPALTAAP
jgi:hypothetical protein